MDVAVVFAYDRGRVLLCRVEREPAVWDALSEPVEGTSDAAARRAAEAIGVNESSLIDGGPPVRAGGRTLHPYRLVAESGIETPTGSEWVHPTEIRRRRTPSGLWDAYGTISPTVAEVRDDRTHGSAHLSIRALEVLRDRAGEGAGPSELVDVAVALIEARPSMAAVVNRVNRAMVEADTESGFATALEGAARDGIDRAVEADREAAERAATGLSGTVLTLSRSGTVREALMAGDPDRVVILESRPGCEGTDVGRELADALDVTVTLDAAVAHKMEAVDQVLVGCDTVLADGSVSNKVGTRTAATVAAREGVPVRVVSAAAKISPSTEPALERVDRGAITDDERLAVDCPLFAPLGSSLPT
ncbi:initiation factor 2B-like protein [Halalkalicoccus subterraneus]|uniref:initiation factor 2B-like protein n=1 Tax=Halalkalicoccus subterraneus TaxID=2675002 RepID=UPI001FEB8EB8|nr:initiation factor 2B-like protein [Halalkalicoccus subterraneus]